MAIGGRSADAVVSFETLEHLVRPEVVVAGFAALLPPGGCLICSVPSALHEPRTRTLLPRNRRHRQLFTFDSFARLLDRAGFEIEYRLGQARSTAILKRETELVRSGILDARLGNRDALHDPGAIRWFARVLAYPSAENAEASYSMITLAKRR
jgi:SAM-dependent methyltransferase